MRSLLIVRAIKKFNRYLTWRNHLKKYDQKKWHFILKYGLGDAYLVCTLLKQFAAIHGDFILIFEKKNQVNIPDFFFKKHSSYYDNQIPYNLIKEFGKQIKGMPVVLHPIDLNDQISPLIGYNKITLLDIYKILLNIDLHSKPNNNLLPCKILKKTFYSDKVLLCPQANSVSTLSINFWIKLANLIANKGYQPIFLRTNDTEIYESIDFPIEDAITMCNNFHAVISIRSGFCDLISTCNTKKIIIYPEIQWRSGKLIDSTSLVSMGLCANNEQLLEIELSNSNLEIIYDEILNFI